MMVEHKPHPHIERRKKFAHDVSVGGINEWLAVKVTAIVGSMWCAYAFAILCFISLPEAIKGGTGPLITWICQTFLQLVLLSIIIVGQNVASEKSQSQLEQTYKDAEALLEIHDQMHHLLKVNEELTEKAHSALVMNTELTRQLHEVVNDDSFVLSER